MIILALGLLLFQQTAKPTPPQKGEPIAKAIERQHAAMAAKQSTGNLPLASSPQGNVITLTKDEQIEILTMQRDVEVMQASELQEEIKARDEMTALNKQTDVLNKKLDALRTAHHLGPEAFWHGDSLTFTVPPTK
jgi:hypothetical protein